MSLSQRGIRRYVRFRLRSLLLLPVVFALGWWWVSWPERTARRFVELLAAGDVAAAKAMFDGPPASDGFWTIVASKKFEFDRPLLHSGSVIEYLTSKRDFDVRSSSEGVGEFGPFRAERNHVGLSPSADNTPLFTVYGLKQVNAELVASTLGPLYANDDADRFVGDAKNKRVLVRGPRRAHQEVRALIWLLERGEWP